MILDTNAYTALARGDQAIAQLIHSAREICLPLPVIAELRYGFANGSRSEHNEQILERFLAQAQTRILIPTIETTKHYAQLQLLCTQRGRALSHNDIWIAALAQEHAIPLATYDKDFEVFTELFGDRLHLLTAS